MNTEILKVEGMSCQHCVNRVSEAIKNISANAEVDISLQDKTVIVKFDESIDINSIKSAITDVGYEVL